MVNKYASSMIGFAVGKAVFFAMKAFLHYLYYSVLTFLVACFVVFTSMALIFVSSFVANPAILDIVPNTILTVVHFFERFPNQTVNFSGSLNEDQIRQLIVQASLVVTIVGAIIHFVGTLLFKQKKSASKYVDHKKAYLIAAGCYTLLAAISSGSIMLETEGSDRIMLLFVVLVFLLLSYAALFLLRLLNRSIDSVNLLVNLIKPMNNKRRFRLESS